MKDQRHNWQLCKSCDVLRAITSSEPDEWNGILHRPTCTFFKIEDGKAEVMAMAVPPLESWTERRLKALAVKWFYSGLVSKYPPEPVERPKAWAAAHACRPRSTYSACL